MSDPGEGGLKGSSPDFVFEESTFIITIIPNVDDTRLKPLRQIKIHLLANQNPGTNVEQRDPSLQVTN